MLLAAFLAIHASAPGAADATSDAATDAAQAGAAPASLPARPYDRRPAVTIYEFRSGVPEVNAAAATDMFTTALIKSGQFRVLERERLSQGVVAEKQLNAAGQTTGDTAKVQLQGVRYIFEGIVSEADASEDAHQTSVNVGGLAIGGGCNRDRIAIDVRIVDAQTGEVLDSVDVSHTLHDTTSSVNGTLALASTIAALHGHNASPFVPDVSTQNSHKDSVGQALRACIEASVQEIARRLAAPADASASH